jgi:hypothetical protein
VSGRYTAGAEPRDLRARRTLKEIARAELQNRERIVMTDLDEFNRQQSLGNFPPNRRWQRVEGIVHQPRSKPGAKDLVSIGGRDHRGEEVSFWTDLPNAMYLLNMLTQIQRETGARVPSTLPDIAEPYDGRA